MRVSGGVDKGEEVLVRGTNLREPRARERSVVIVGKG